MPDHLRQVQIKTTQVTLLSAFVNVFLSIVQILAGYFAHSNALIADGIHTLSDLVADFAILLVNKKSHEGPDVDHPYGHARFENIASFVFAFLILIVGAGILWTAVNKLRFIDNIPTVHIAALLVTLLTLLSKETLFRYITIVAKRFQSPLLEINAWHARADVATSLVVVAGIVGNLAGYPILDPIAALLVGGIIIRTGINIGQKALADLTDHALPASQIAAITQALNSVPGIRCIHELRSRRMGVRSLIDVHIEVDPRISVTEGHYIALEAENLIKGKFIGHDILIHVDPYDENRSISPNLPQRHDIDNLFVPILQRHNQMGWHYTIHYVDHQIEITLVLKEALKPAVIKKLHAELLNSLPAKSTIQLLFETSHGRTHPKFWAGGYLKV